MDILSSARPPCDAHSAPKAKVELHKALPSEPVIRALRGPRLQLNKQLQTQKRENAAASGTELSSPRTKSEPSSNLPGSDFFTESDFVLRRIEPRDEAPLRAMHLELFPLDYDNRFFANALDQTFYGLGVFLRPTLASSIDGSVNHPNNPPLYPSFGPEPDDNQERCAVNPQHTPEHPSSPGISHPKSGWEIPGARWASSILGLKRPNDSSSPHTDRTHQGSLTFNAPTLLPRPEPLIATGIMSFDFAVLSDDVRRLVRYFALERARTHLAVEVQQQCAWMSAEDARAEAGAAVESMVEEWPGDHIDRLRGACCYLLTLGVLQEFHHKGLGLALVECLKRKLQSVGRHFLILHVAAYNEAALKMYEKAGFFLAAHLPAYYVINEKRHDAYLAAFADRPEACGALQEIVGAILTQALMLFRRHDTWNGHSPHQIDTIYNEL